jgi:(p)ppGpp synthase/HD superfamily hydrolase
VESLRRSRRAWVVDVARRLTQALEADGVRHEIIEHRVKHVAGAWKKMQDHQIELDQVNDLFAFRIVVIDEEACYLALAAIHRAFEPNPLRFKDYIAEPKANGYQSLHTSLRDAEGRLFEVQIRSVAMHREAEDGQAAHWQYRARRWGSIPQTRSSALVRRLRRVAGSVSGRRPA